MAYLSTDEDQKLQAAGQMGAPQGGSAVAPRQARSGFVNLQKYLGGGDQTTGKITGGIEQEKGALGQDIGKVEQAGQQLGSMLTNPGQYTAQQFQQASGAGSNSDFSQRAGALGQSIANLSTDTGRFEALKNAQSPTATGGQSRLNQYLMSHGTGGQAIGQYAQQNEGAQQALQNRYGQATQGVQGGTQALRDALTSERGRVSGIEGAYNKEFGALQNANDPKAINQYLQDRAARLQELINRGAGTGDPMYGDRIKALQETQRQQNLLNQYTGLDRSRMNALQNLMGA